mmetsp:Transcript_58737/g.130913  ORF Transcript_58737/g.130913 Transcript_58737/m.130913 type:complete len:86 (+) Transcript_58737:166-423(+)
MPVKGYKVSAQWTANLMYTPQDGTRQDRSLDLESKITRLMGAVAHSSTRRGAASSRQRVPAAAAAAFEWQRGPRQIEAPHGAWLQ